MKTQSQAALENLAQALQFCERHRIYHGLIKPSNVSIAADGQAKLLDFGVGAMLAEGEEESVVDTLSAANATFDMLDCTAPEVIADPQRRSVGGDQYGLGCTLYFGLTGRYPFPDGDAVEKVVAHRSREPVPLAILNPGVPPALVMVVERLMRKAPEERYPDLEELVSTLLPMARQSATYVSPPTPSSLGMRSPTMTPAPTGPSLLSAVTRRPMAAPPVGEPELTPRPPMARVSAPPPVGKRPFATESEAYYPPIPLHAPTAMPSARRPRKSGLMKRLGRALTFWRPSADPVALTRLTPAGVLPGEVVAVQVVAHHASRSEQARLLPDWRGSEPMPVAVERGGVIGLHLELDGAAVEKPLAELEWKGLSSATLFNVAVPPDWPTGAPIGGVLTIGLDRKPVTKLAFELPVGAGAPA